MIPSVGGFSSLRVVKAFDRTGIQREAADEREPLRPGARSEQSSPMYNARWALQPRSCSDHRVLMLRHRLWNRRAGAQVPWRRLAMTISGDIRPWLPESFPVDILTDRRRGGNNEHHLSDNRSGDSLRSRSSRRGISSGTGIVAPGTGPASIGCPIPFARWPGGPDRVSLAWRRHPCRRRLFGVVQCSIVTRLSIAPGGSAEEASLRRSSTETSASSGSEWLCPCWATESFSSP